MNDAPYGLLVGGQAGTHTPDCGLSSYRVSGCLRETGRQSLWHCWATLCQPASNVQVCMG
jgi:hypothetical protein